MACRIDHTAPDAMPQALCRVCHPELILSKQERDERDLRDAERQAHERRIATKQRELRTASERLTKLESKRQRRGLSSVDERVAHGLATKVHRLEQEVARLKAA